MSAELPQSYRIIRLVVLTTARALYARCQRPRDARRSLRHDAFDVQLACVLEYEWPVVSDVIDVLDELQAASDGEHRLVRTCGQLTLAPRRSKPSSWRGSKAMQPNRCGRSVGQRARELAGRLREVGDGLADASAGVDFKSRVGFDGCTAIGAREFEGLRPLVCPLHAAAAAGHPQPNAQMLGLLLYLLFDISHGSLDA